VKQFLLILTLFLVFSSGSSFAQCINADPFCTGTTYTFPNTTGAGDLGPVGCLDGSGIPDTPNPSWYYMEIDQNGDLIFDISQQDANGTGLDVDFIIWGPYSSLSEACNGANPFPIPPTSGSTSVDCSYAPDPIETATIPNAQIGEVYITLITNFSDSPGTITFSQTGGSGSADCSFTCGVTLTANPTACSSNTYTLNGNLSISGGPGISTPK
jgi:hypothetical protein